jgi:hypothetical protein
MEKLTEGGYYSSFGPQNIGKQKSLLPGIGPKRKSDFIEGGKNESVKICPTGVSVLARDRAKHLLL